MSKSFQLYKEKTTKELLDQLTFVTAFNPVQYETLAAYLQAYSIPPGTALIEENQINDSLYFLCEGSVQVIKKSSDESQKILQTLTKGDVVGEASFFDHTPCSASVVAVEKTIILALDRGNFVTLCIDSPHTALALSLELVRNLTLRLRHTSNQLVNLL
jgi:CRP/FNR family cyclic AMP-dependent transcriptional regulator